MKLRYSDAWITGAALSALAAVLPLGLSSCSSDDFDSENGRSASITLTVTKAMADDDATRTQLREENGSLVASWTAGENPDRLLVADASGRRLGYLTLTAIDPNDPATATFNGNLDNLTDDDTQQLRIFYLGTKADATTATAPLTLSYANQQGTMESLTDADLLTGEVSATLQGTVIAANDHATLTRKVAHAHFKLNLPVTATEPMAVTITGDNVKNSIVMNSFNGDFATADGAITVTATAEGDFYMTVVPADGVTLTFTTSVGGKSYRGTLPSRDWTNQEYVRAGEDSGVAITMTEFNDPYAEYANEDPRNPLHKFAKYNLTRQGDQEDWSNVFTTSETENGALYQWGRNYGYMDTKGVTYPGSNVYVSGDFTNYIDAMGVERVKWYDRNGKEVPATSSEASKSRAFDYCVYNPNLNFVVSGTGVNLYTYNYQYFSAQDVPYYGYGQKQDIVERPTAYLIDYATKTGDYWISKFGDGGSDWTERAQACGYQRTNPCPAGWRMPTHDDFIEIIPQKQQISSTTNLSTLLSNQAKPELRRSATGVKYVIRWQNYNGYLRIQALVVDEDFEESQIAAITWDNNSDIVTRIFPFTGNVSSQFYVDNEQPTSPIDIVFPGGLGTYMKKTESLGSFWTFYLEWTHLYPGQNYGSALGGYWTGDNTKTTLQFFDRSKAGNSGSSEFGMRTADAETAYAIRPVMDL